MVSGGEENASTFEFTPTWILGSVCAVIVLFFLLFEKALEFATKALNKMAKNGTRFEALKKVKEELMLVGFISLLLSVFQGPIQKICIPESLTQHGLPCKRYSPSVSHIVSVAHFSTDLPLHFTSSKSTRELLASESSSHCKDGRVPLLSLEAVHQLHIFLFVLAITHLVLSFATIALGISMMEKWKHLEAEVRQRDDDRNTYAIIRTKDRVPVFIKDPSFKWLRSLFRQFYAPVTLSDYLVIRLGFIMVRSHFC
ncbi:hypothetical protein LUZ60_004528 [Juncus effusus]|nr:hypothetical protein LUZ60_004528 [Juncus effusus]